MKQIISILALFVTISSFAQWSFKKKHDVFDGDYIVALGKGKKGKPPYDTPSFVINKINDSYNMYVTGMGSTSCGELSLLIKTDVNDKTYSFNLSKNKDGDTVFLEYFNFEDETVLVDTREMLQDFKKGSVAYFKWETRCSSNRWEMSLSGSSAAINSTEFIKTLDKLLSLSDELRETGTKIEELKKEKQLLKETSEKYVKWKKSLTDDINSIFEDYDIIPPYYEGDLKKYVTNRLLDEIHNEKDLVEYFQLNKFSNQIISHFSVEKNKENYVIHKRNENGWVNEKITLLGWKIEKKQ